MARTITIGIDQGTYSFVNDTRVITLDEITFTPTQEALAYVVNLTQKEEYYAPMSPFIRAEVDGMNITLTDPSKATLKTGDILHVQFWIAENAYSPAPSYDIDPNQRMSLNTVFGEKMTGVRRTDIAAQFQYGYTSDMIDEETTNGGTVTTVESLLTVSTGTNTAGTARANNRKALRYMPGHEAYMYFTSVFTEGVSDSYQRIGIFDDNNGFFIGYEGTSFVVTRRRNGVDELHPITIEDVFLDGSFDPTKGNIYKISYGYLGFAVINFEVMTVDGSFVVMHKINYPNSYEVSHIMNTNLQPRLEVANTGNSSNIVMKTASYSAGIVDGAGEDPASRNFSFAGSDITITAGEYMLVSFRNKSTFNSLTNYIPAILTLLSPATDLSKNSVWEIRKNMTVTNTPTWTDVNTTDSIIEYSTDAVVTSGTGILLIPFTMGKVDSKFEDIENQKTDLYPGEVGTFIIKTPGGTNGTVDLGIRWKELF